LPLQKLSNMLRKFVPVFIFTLFVSLTSRSQQRLELLETNIAETAMPAYGESYVWTKNWWLSNGMMVPVEKGGPSVGVTSELQKGRIDSLSKLFNTFLPAKVMRHGGLKPRINYLKSKAVPFIQTTVFEINGEEVKAVCQFKITFAHTQHNKMPDIQDITITPIDKIKPYDKNVLIKTFKRAPTSIESEMTPPEVERID
jgi:hypothetical protein